MNKSHVISLISREALLEAECIDYDNIIHVIEDAFKEYHSGQVLLPEKISQIFDDKLQNRINCMPSTLYRDKISGVKWVSVFPENPRLFGKPNVSGIIILSEIETGFPIAVMDGTLITAIRTAAIGAIGAKYLARRDSETYGSIGAGEEAMMHFRLIKHVCPKIRTVFVASRTSESEKRFASILSSEYPDVSFSICDSDYRKASKEADIIVTAVSCQKPLLKADAIKPGAYYCHVGGWEDEYEVALKADKIVCDNWEALKHRGSPTLAKLYSQGRLKDQDIYGNLDEIICELKPGRENEQEFIYFNSIGLSFVDVAVANSFYKIAKEKAVDQKWTI